jgi:MFS family permease
MLDTLPRAAVRARAPYGLATMLGLGGLVWGATGPLVSNFVPLLAASLLGDRPATIGWVMAIDNLLLLVLVPWAGAQSDRASADGRGRLRLVVPGLVIAAAGMALVPLAPLAGVAGLIGALVALHGGLNLQRSPFLALLTDLVPSRDRPLATSSMTLQMCVGAILFLLLGSRLGMQPAFFVAAVTLLGVALVFATGLREPGRSAHGEVGVTFTSLAEAVLSVARGVLPGLRAIVIAVLFLQLAFQTFTTWFALHASSRWNLGATEVAGAFIAWALGGVIGSLPAGVLGRRLGRRATMLIGFALMGASLLALDRVGDLRSAIPFIALTSAAWALPIVNAFPMFVETVHRDRRGVIAALYLLSIALGGAIGDPLNGALFALADGYRLLFLMMAGYAAIGLAAVLCVPAGSGEADSGVGDDQFGRDV